MACAINRFSTLSTPSEGSHIEFFFDDKEKESLTVTIDTERLHLRSLCSSKEDRSAYLELFGDAKVMELFATGKPQPESETVELLDRWTTRWYKNDPYSSLAVFEADTDQFLGQVTVGHSEPGETSLGYCFMQKFWRKGIATEAVTAVVKEYLPATVAKGYQLEGKTLERVTATALRDNIASCRILEGLGMHQEAEETHYGALRSLYSLNLSELPKR